MFKNYHNGLMFPKNTPQEIKISFLFKTL